MDSADLGAASGPIAQDEDLREQVPDLVEWRQRQEATKAGCQQRKAEDRVWRNGVDDDSLHHYCKIKDLWQRTDARLELWTPNWTTSWPP
jgi:hypothetical protein